MNRIAGVWRLQAKDLNGALYRPWLIMMAIFTVSLIALNSVSSEGISYNGSIATLYIYSFVFSIVLVGQTFPYAVGMSVRRSDYFKGTMLFLAATSAVSAAGTILLVYMERWTSSWGGNYQFFDLPFINDGNVVQQYVVILVLLLTFNIWGFFLGSLHRRFRAKGVLIFFGALMVLQALLAYIPGGFAWMQSAWDWVYVRSAFELALWQVPIIALFAVLSWALLQKAEA